MTRVYLFLTSGTSKGHQDVVQNIQRNSNYQNLSRIADPATADVFACGRTAYWELGRSRSRSALAIDGAVSRIATKYSTQTSKTTARIGSDSDLVALMMALASCSCTAVSFVPTRPPNHAKTAHHKPLPTSVSVLNFRKPIRMMPAGIEIRCRITGSNRAKKIPPASYRRMNSSARASFSGGIKTNLPQRRIAGRPTNRAATYMM